MQINCDPTTNTTKAIQLPLGARSYNASSTAIVPSTAKINVRSLVISIIVSLQKSGPGIVPGPEMLGLGR